MHQLYCANLNLLMFANCFFPTMKNQWIWTISVKMKNGEKKSIFVVFFFLYDGFQFSKINFWFTFRKKKLVTQREKKVRCASAGIKVIFVFSLLLFILRIKTMSCVIIIFDPVIETSHSCNTCWQLWWFM